MAGIEACRVLVVEDEFFLAHDLCEELQAVGAQVVGPAGSLAEALDLATRSAAADVALLDVNLRHQTVHPILSLLRKQGVPCLLLTGDPAALSDPGLAGIPLLEKPVSMAHVVTRLEQLWRGIGPKGGYRGA